MTIGEKVDHVEVKIENTILTMKRFGNKTSATKCNHSKAGGEEVEESYYMKELTTYNKPSRRQTCYRYVRPGYFRENFRMVLPAALKNQYQQQD